MKDYQAQFILFSFMFQTAVSYRFSKVVSKAFQNIYRYGSYSSILKMDFNSGGMCILVPAMITSKPLFG